MIDENVSVKLVIVVQRGPTGKVVKMKYERWDRVIEHEAAFGDKAKFSEIFSAMLGHLERDMA